MFKDFFGCILYFHHPLFSLKNGRHCGLIFTRDLDLKFLPRLHPESKLKTGKGAARLPPFEALHIISIELAHETDSRFSGNAHQHGMMFKIMNILKQLEKPAQQAIRPLLEYVKEQKAKGEKVDKSSLYDTRNPKFCEKKYRHQNIECNRNGLSREGKRFVEELMKRRWMIPLDHLSRKARREVFEIAKRNNYYPLFASHTRADAIMHPEERRGDDGSHEYMITNDDLSRIRQTGGVVGLRTSDYAMKEIPGCINKDINCWGSAQSLAQNICWAAKTGMAMSFGTDFAGPVTMTAPQYSHRSKLTSRWDRLPAACPRHVQLGYVTPFGYRSKYLKYKPKMKAVKHDDYRVRGLAHTGHLKSLLEELRSLGAPLAQTRMDNSAETFIRMWERAYERKGKLTDHEYRTLMGTSVKKYGNPKKALKYDHHLKKLFTKGAKLKAKGSKKCDSLIDWEQMIKKSHQKARKCPLGKRRVAYKDGILYCEYGAANPFLDYLFRIFISAKDLPKSIKSEDCTKTIINGYRGEKDKLLGYCAWRQLFASRPYYLAIRLKEHMCPKGFVLIKAKVDSEKPYCSRTPDTSISEAKCPEWNGKTTQVKGFCVRDKGNYYHARKLAGYNKMGQRKCPKVLKRVELATGPAHIYCKALVATPISKTTCLHMKRGATNMVTGYCTKKESFYYRIWKLTGHNKKGERKCPLHYKKMKVKNSPATLYCRYVTASPISISNCTKDGGTMGKLNGYCAFKKGSWYHVRKLKGHNKSGKEKCGSALYRIDLNPKSGKKYCIYSKILVISKAACATKRGKVSTSVKGYCERQESGYVRVWRLKGFSVHGVKKYNCPVGWSKVTVKNRNVFCQQGGNNISATMCREKRGSTRTLKGYCAWKKNHYYKVQGLK